MSVATPLERSDDLDAMRAAAANAAAGHGVMVLVEGPSGIGKSTLLHAFAARDRNCILAAGRDLERDLPFGVARRLIEPLLSRPATRRQISTGAAGPVLSWLDAGVPPENSVALSRALFSAFTALAADEPLTLVVDDAHDADPASLLLLVQLATEIDELPLLLVVAVRSGARDGNPTLRRLAAQAGLRVTPTPLGSEAAECILTSAVGSAPSPRFLEAFMVATGGVPFYCHELARELGARHLSPDDASAALIGQVELSHLIDGSLLRFAGLEDTARSLLRAAAVLGDAAPVGRCAALARLDPDDAAECADALVAAGVLKPGPGLTIVHGLVQSAVLADLGPHALARWHERAAVLLQESGSPPDSVAQHLMRCEPTGLPWASGVLRVAGDQALRSGASASAAAVYHRALREPFADADADLVFAAGYAAACTGDPDASRLLATAVEGTLDPVTRAERALQLALTQSRGGDPGRAVGTLATAADGLAPGSDLHLLVSGMTFLYQNLATDHHQAAALDWSRLRPWCEGPMSAGRAALSLCLASHAAQVAPREEALALLEPAVACESLVEVAQWDSTPLFVAVETSCALDADDLTADLLGRMEPDALRRGSLLDLLMIRHFHAYAAFQQDRPAAVEEAVAQVITGAALSGWGTGKASAYAMLACSLVDQGRFDQAAEALATAWESDLAIGLPGALVRLAAGRVAAHRGDHADAVGHFLVAGDLVLATGGVSPGLAPWREHAVQELALLGDRAEAQRLAEETIGLAERLGGPRTGARALHALGALRADEAMLREALEMIGAARVAGLGRPRILADLGAVVRRSGRSAAALPLLREALDGASALGAAPLAGRVRMELQIAGARPRRDRAYGAPALTAAERRVAELAARGLTNASISRELFVTPKTVEKHLAAAYRKLQIARRSELAQAL